MHPILVQIGPVTIYSYGVAVAAAFLLSSLLILRKATAFGIPQDDLWDILLLILIFGVAGARMLHVLLNFGYYNDNLIEIIMFHKGGLAIHGGIALALAAALVAVFKKGLPAWKTGDLIILYLPLGQAIGRIGCFFNGCCYGIGGHPAQIYSSVALLCIFVLLNVIYKRFKRFDGDILLSYFLMYCPARFGIDFLRGDLAPEIYGLTTSHILSAAIFAAALFIYIYKLTRIRKG
ncbi:MAG: prolipoprotein diacylglyceryl transferase [Candidatus Omnitrophota bacterium]